MCISALLLTELSAAEKVLMDLDFTKPDTKEILYCNGGKFSIKDGALIVQPRSQLSLPAIPWHNGSKIHVELEVACNEIVPNKKAWNAAWVTVDRLNAIQKPMGHSDIIILQGTHPWKKYKKTFSFPDGTSFFILRLNNFGISGTASYKNIKITMTMPDYEDMIGDSVFKQRLGADYWYFPREGERDWDKMLMMTADGKITKDATKSIAGKNALAIENCGAMKSKEFPYHGEKLILRGFLRVKGLVPGKKESWCGAGIQIVGLDAQNNAIAHQDLYLSMKDIPWRYFEKTVNFAGTVKKVMIVIRMFEGAKGKLWADGIQLLRIPSKSALKPMNTAKSVVKIDLAKPEKAPINHRAWGGIDALFPHWLFRADFAPKLDMLRDAGFEMIRVRELSNTLKMYPKDNPDGTPVYNFKEFDKMIDLLRKKYDFIPIFTLGTIPPALDKKDAVRKWGINSGAPRDFVKWGKFIEAIFVHSIKKYGVKEVNKWYWNIWNEPFLGTNRGDYTGTAEEFVKLAEAIYLAKERVDKKYGSNIRMGITAGGSGEELILNRLKALGKLGLIEHYSKHYYGGASASLRSTMERLSLLRYFEKAYPGMKHYETGCTEYNSDAMISDVYSTVWNAPFAAKIVKYFLDAGVGYSVYFATADHPDIPRPPAPHITFSQGMFTRGDMPLPKAVYNTFVLLKELKGGYRIPAESDTDPVDVISVVKKDGSIGILLMNYNEDLNHAPYTTTVKVTIQNAKGNYYCSRNWLVDSTHGDIYSECQRMGGKVLLKDTAAMMRLLKASRYGDMPTIPVNCKNGQITFKVSLPWPGVRYIELRKAAN